MGEFWVTFWVTGLGMSSVTALGYFVGYLNGKLAAEERQMKRDQELWR